MLLSAFYITGTLGLRELATKRVDVLFFGCRATTLVEATRQTRLVKQHLISAVSIMTEPQYHNFHIIDDVYLYTVVFSSGTYMLLSAQLYVGWATVRFLTTSLCSANLREASQRCSRPDYYQTAVFNHMWKEEAEGVRFIDD